MTTCGKMDQKRKKKKIKKGANTYIRNLKDKKILETILCHLTGKHTMK